MSTVVCITGMGRSGTSLTAAWLQRCGLVIDIGGLLGPAVGNPRGHFEDLQIMQLHRQEILARRPWSQGWRVTRREYMAFSPSGYEQASELVRARNARFEQWGWKDPRGVLFLPDWLRIVPDLATLIVWRPAQEVVDSLIRRSRQPGSKGVRVSQFTAWRTWLAYNTLVTEFKRSHPDRVLLVSLDRLLTADIEVVDALRAKFGVCLRHEPITATFEPKLLNAGGESRPYPLARCNRSAALEARTLEEQLASLSDI